MLEVTNAVKNEATAVDVLAVVVVVEVDPLIAAQFE